MKVIVTKQMFDDMKQHVKNVYLFENIDVFPKNSIFIFNRMDKLNDLISSARELSKTTIFLSNVKFERDFIRFDKRGVVKDYRIKPILNVLEPVGIYFAEMRMKNKLGKSIEDIINKLKKFKRVEYKLV